MIAASIKKFLTTNCARLIKLCMLIDVTVIVLVTPIILLWFLQNSIIYIKVIGRMNIIPSRANTSYLFDSPLIFSGAAILGIAFLWISAYAKAVLITRHLPEDDKKLMRLKRKEHYMRITKFFMFVFSCYVILEATTRFTVDWVS